MKFFKNVIFISLILLSAYSKAQTLNVFVSSHPDDWQLFMNPNAYHSLDSLQNKTIFLHVTAGDAGAEMTDNYYLAREEGSLRAIRFMVNAHGNKPDYGKEMKIDSSKINGHNILNYEYANAKAYFFRLHDGYIVANDTMVEHEGSLRRFYSGISSSIAPLDKSTTYNSIDDLKKTMKQLVEKEATGFDKIIFHLADTDSTLNINDHIDHLHSSKIMQEVAEESANTMVYLYEEYSTSTKPLNVHPEDYLISAGTWGATASGLSDLGHYPTWDAAHNSWVGKQYFRIKKQ
ncbi:GlcNAc-PI de-N-acetylase [Flavobacteriaceae bacterium MAR_2010_188]|nr:GlcNAc-PI de-N-acetylase [Flavobacteriaceae bacterium MAR_2010_188]